MGVNSVNDAGSAYGAAFRNKPVYFMTGKETEAFFDGKMQTQYDAGNLKGYLDYKQFWDFLDNK
ncbi:hypothetical protein D5282_26105 [bacterium 1xD8-48]|nr:hypothetical protein [bacterium 1xD8-48]